MSTQIVDIIHKSIGGYTAGMPTKYCTSLKDMASGSKGMIIPLLGCPRGEGYIVV